MGFYVLSKLQCCEAGSIIISSLQRIWSLRVFDNHPKGKWPVSGEVGT